MATYLLTAAELARRLRLRPRTIRAWASAGLIPCVRLGARTIRYDLRAVLRALAEGEREEGGTDERA